MKAFLVSMSAVGLLGAAALAVGPRGGGGGGGGGFSRPAGGGGGGGGISRPSMPSPSFSGGGGARPPAPASRPNPPSVSDGPRPGMVPSPQPRPAANPGGGMANRPNTPGGNPGPRPNPPGPGGATGGVGTAGGGPRPGSNVGGVGAGAIGGGVQNRPVSNIGGAGAVGGVGGVGNVNRPNVGDKTNIGSINRPQINNPYVNTGDKFTNIKGGNTVNQFNQNNVNVNRPGYGYPGYRPGYPGYGGGVGYRPPYPPPYRPNWNHWNSGSWRPWTNNPGLWFGTGVAFGWLTSPGQTVAYSNPYYVAPPVTEVVYNYAQPIPVEAPAEVSAPTEVPVQVPTALPVPAAAPATNPTPPEPVSSEKNDEAIRNFDAARASFKSNDYDKALSLIEASIKLQPGDASLHEFRGLDLFALKKYQDSAAAVYAVLAEGPGWDWATIKSLYDQPSTYTQQLRDLEAFQKANPKAGYASFLLAYHYLALDSIPQAITQLENAVACTPGDELSKLLLKSLTSSSDKPAPAK